jgi:hypothetical protein
LVALVLWGALSGTGCGLTLDYDPPDPVGIDGGRRDGGVRDGGDGAMPECETDEQCDDGNVCDGIEQCVAGRCEGGAGPRCGDGIDCTDDGCDPTTGCFAVPRDERCRDDGLTCTVERCDPTGGCVSELRHELCDDGIPCTDDICDPLSRSGCRHEPRDALCGLARCDVELGCVGIECESDASCALGPCDESAACVDGRCERVVRPDGHACDDGNPCTPTSECSGGTCRGRATTLCPGRACWRCNPAGGGCDGSLIASAGTPCSDENLCTEGDQCTATGECGSTVIRACPSIGPCRDSVCNPSTGLCTSTIRTGPCDDSNRCTTGDVCERGTCVGTPVMCADTDPRLCVAARCDNLSGGCVTGPVPDGTTCGEREVCMGGECRCQAGFSDCDGDGRCECFGACGTSGPMGSRTCVPAVDCGGCPSGQLCCPCTGMCFDATCLSCCMFCGMG